MHEEKFPLRDKQQTVNGMYNIIEKYYTDLRLVLISLFNDTVPIAYTSLNQYFDYVKNIPYRQDVKPKEIIVRPYYIFRYKDLGMDCKKKAIAIASYLRYWKLNFRLVGSSVRPDGLIHHVFPQVKYSGQWKNLDATYDNYKMFQPKKVTNIEILKPE